MSSIPNQDAMDANRNGRLALSQATSLMPLIVLGGVFFLTGALILGGLIYAVISGRIEGSVVPGVIFGGVFSLLFFLFAYLVGGAPLIELMMGKVSHIEGKAFKGETQRRTEASSGTLHTFMVGKEQFQVSKKNYEALPESGMVRAYYTPLKKKLVNVEKI